MPVITLNCLVNGNTCSGRYPLAVAWSVDINSASNDNWENKSNASKRNVDLHKAVMEMTNRTHKSKHPTYVSKWGVAE